MTWPRPLPPADRGALARASALARALGDPALHAAAAAAWARALEVPVEVGPLEGTPPRHGMPVAQVGWRAADGAAGRLAVDAHLLAGALQVLGGAPAAAVGPAPLSPAEEGLFAYLALAWLGLMRPPLLLDWVHGGDPAWPAPTDGAGALDWRVRIGDRQGVARWWLPAAPPAPGPVEAVPIPLRVAAEPLRLGPGPLAPGDRLPLTAPLRLYHARGPLRPLELVGGRLRMAADAESLPMNEASLEALPVLLSVHLGDLVLTAAQVAALQPGALLPLRLDDPPVVTLRAGDRVVAVGVLVADEGGVAVQVTRS